MKTIQLSTSKFYLNTNLEEKWKALKAKLNAWRVRHKTRAHLARLDDRMLSDIGLSRYDANKEAEKPFWED
ncbi:hypothetical protein A3742_08855 [Oleiphilus sp. HI0071]|uniref:DUF1127 domain-containing protein n=1 Tax=unclassified Oleiphilus TaxID=2631174 RepID=UPI0007C2A6CC|nr:MULTISPECIES: DUF1127 domain-containing protein [unclassified Oleiphilus]KZY68922.1 hypothetical protein A3737_12610 [Oleiphilus sp. HI0065]KZY82631.1 hypothetical protein A3742_08855 [Oleiphilus sp. HI0071]KZY92626.1 hypothetical protein A3744_02710 [Oleiphilus sp. HI0073]KZZ44549.1 hypothetical protein A3758_14775 [Oleiphilus sp. HI0118]KZZ53000.1 hypothetical protein A3760_09830 [Oleiphilus sp. HI0122]KZZ64071.1 hypothetical protein A3765_07310 [Oleiphilus sp. HI0130]KZZ75718.1 hypothe